VFHIEVVEAIKVLNAGDRVGNLGVQPIDKVLSGNTRRPAVTLNNLVDRCDILCK
jgi:hypothetical protein